MCSAPTCGCGPTRRRRRPASRCRPHRLLLEHGPELGARRHAEGAAGGRRPRPRRRVPEAIRPFSGAATSISRRWPNLCHEAADRRPQAHRPRPGPTRRRGSPATSKLGPGGIREIEFLAQTLQLVWGGRDPALRTGARWRRWHCWTAPATCRPAPPSSWPPPMASCAGSSTGCRWWPTGRPTRCRKNPCSSPASPVSWATRRRRAGGGAAAPHDPGAGGVSGGVRRRGRPRGEGVPAPLDFAGTGELPPATRRRWPPWASPTPSGSARRCAAGRPAGCGRCARCGPAN